MLGTVGSLRASERNTLSSDFSRLPQMESLLAGLASIQAESSFLLLDRKEDKRRPVFLKVKSRFCPHCLLFFSVSVKENHPVQRMRYAFPTTKMMPSISVNV